MFCQVQSYRRAVLIIFMGTWVPGCVQSRAEPGEMTLSQEAAACAGTHRGDLTLSTPEEVRAASHWEVVEGNLVLGDWSPAEGMAPPQMGEVHVEPGQLGCLRRVTGALQIGALVQAGNIVIEGLERIDGHLVAGFVSNSADAPALLSLPALHTVGDPSDTDGKGVQIAESLFDGGVFLPALETVHGLVSIGSVVTPTLDLGSLRSVAGTLAVGFAKSMDELSMGEVREVGGSASFVHLPKVPFSLVDAWTDGISAEGIEVQAVGCGRDDGDASPDCEEGAW